MSFDYSLLVDPLILPEISIPSLSSNHSRSSSYNSFFSCDSTSESVDTQLTTPLQSPIRQNGPLLLPKIRPQDQQIPSSTQYFNSDSFIVDQVSLTYPPLQRYTFPRPFSSNQHITSNFYEMNPLHSQDSFDKLIIDRHASNFEIESKDFEEYDFPTYNSMCNDFPPVTNASWDVPGLFNYNQAQDITSSVQMPISFENNCVNTAQNLPVDGTIISLMDYLSSPNPTPALVRQITINIRNITNKYFWWDIRQIRSWDSFSISTLCSTPDLSRHLSRKISSFTLPVPPRFSSRPENETELSNIYNSFYGTKLNAGLSLLQSPRHLFMRQTDKNSSNPSFISNYIDDSGHSIYNYGAARVVGLVKSYDLWNSGMRVEGNHRKVKYLRGLSNLHYHMRQHGCRYGFILTEIEIVVARNGIEDVPYFGFLEIQTIQLATHNVQMTDLESAPVVLHEDVISQKRPKMTALLALWYLHMLARDEIIPGQACWKTEIGSVSEGTRQKCLKKDDWIPEPQLAEKREAKRIRGWVFAEDSIGRKEVGKRGTR